MLDLSPISMSLANRRRAAVAVGGAIGAIGRALIIDIVGGSGLDPLWATLFVNLTGSLALGLLVGRHTGRARSSMRCGRQASTGLRSCAASPDTAPRPSCTRRTSCDS
ncbi:MAG TPA: CrcB family protein, partial [Acidimicrobiia bacterium]|nr:CrcB family protein [Acidimicrobiia bacterium]